MRGSETGSGVALVVGGGIEMRLSSERLKMALYGAMAGFAEQHPSLGNPAAAS